LAKSDKEKDAGGAGSRNGNLRGEKNWVEYVVERGGSVKGGGGEGIVRGGDVFDRL
jgi:hypothetical protein